ncbi:4-hydroxyphenylacetate 3-monooxygenase [Pseudonocardia sp. N23]|nr:4-hydroxyphenylacetate 3-monooxygenase [Pseudonocardia sp. N23]
MFLDGDLVKDVTAHPETRAIAETMASVFDLQHRPDLRHILTITTDDGEVQGSGWMIPKSLDELIQRRQVTEILARETGTTITRSPEHGAISLLGMHELRHDFANGDQDRLDAFDEIWRRCSSEDTAFVQGWIDPQYDRRKPAAQTDLIRVVEKNGKGIVVRGVKSIATQGAYANTILVGTFPRPGLSPDQIMYFAVPANHPGMKIVCRPSHSKHDRENNPLAGRGDELDSMLVFDDSFIPWENVIAQGIPPAATVRLFHRLSQFLHWDVLIRQGVRAEYILGAASNVVDSLGTGQIPAVKDHLAELIRFLETIRAFLTAAETLAVPSSWTGTYRPNSLQITAGRTYAAQNWQHMHELLQDLCGSGLLMQPTPADYANEEISPWLNRVHEGVGFTAEERSRIFRLVWDMTATETSARSHIYERFNSAPWFVTRTQLFDRYDRQREKMLALKLAGVDPQKAQVELGQIERPWGSHLDAVNKS